MISVGILEVFSYVIIASGTFVKAFGISELITIATQGDAQRTIRIAAILPDGLPIRSFHSFSLNGKSHLKERSEKTK